MPTDDLLHRPLCVTGQLASMTHAELAALVRSRGGTFLPFPRRGDLTLVVGDCGWPTERDGSPTRVFQRAHELCAAGFAVKFLLEEELLQRLGLIASASAVFRHYTIGDLSRILRVTPGRIRSWVQLGLLAPVESAQRLLYFDFHQASFARRLCDLLAGGASLAAIRKGLEQLRQWLPEKKLPLPQVARLEGNGRLLVRLNHKLIDARRQQHFDFGDDHDPSIAPNFDSLDDLDELFTAALDFEDDGELEQAAETYRRALALDPQEPVLHFNLGNVLYGLGRLHEALGSLEEAVRHDPRYPEAWNNLGNVCAELGRYDQAVRALRRSLSLLPGYELAEANLEQVLKKTGKRSIAENGLLRLVTVD